MTLWVPYCEDCPWIGGPQLSAKLAEGEGAGHLADIKAKREAAAAERKAREARSRPALRARPAVRAVA